MIVIVAADLGFASFRIHPALGGFVASVLCLSLIRIFGAIDRFQARGMPMRTAELVRTSIASAIIATTILVASLVPAFFILPMTILPLPMHHEPSVDTEAIVGIVIAAVLAFPIAALLRRRLW